MADPRGPSFVELAEAYRKEGLFEDAIRICRDGLARFPASVRARVVLAQALLDRGAVEDAAAEFAAAEATGSDDPDLERLRREIELRQVPSAGTGGTLGQPRLAPNGWMPEGSRPIEPPVLTLDTAAGEGARANLGQANTNDPLASPTLARLYQNQGDSARAETILRALGREGKSGYLTQLQALRRAAQRAQKTRGR
jgi:thioredoxin-like negative regulator of GroEL